MMTKQTIEIDVPEGYEVDYHSQGGQYYTTDGSSIDITVNLKQKEREYIEVREYLHKGSNGYVLHNSIQKNLYQKASDIESLPHFIKWLDDDWRKIYL